MKNKTEVRYVEWVDSCTTFGWQPPEKQGLSTIKSCGIVVNETKTALILTTSAGSTGRVLDQIAIPRSAIRKEKKLWV